MITPTTQRPDVKIYSVKYLYQFTYFNTVEEAESYLTQTSPTGKVTLPPYDASRPAKHWFDPSLYSFTGIVGPIGTKRQAIYPLAIDYADDGSLRTDPDRPQFGGFDIVATTPIAVQRSDFGLNIGPGAFPAGSNPNSVGPQIAVPLKPLLSEERLVFDSFSSEAQVINTKLWAPWNPPLPPPTGKGGLTSQEHRILFAIAQKLGIDPSGP